MGTDKGSSSRDRVLHVLPGDLEVKINGQTTKSPGYRMQSRVTRIGCLVSSEVRNIRLIQASCCCDEHAHWLGLDNEGHATLRRTQFGRWKHKNKRTETNLNDLLVWGIRIDSPPHSAVQPKRHRLLSFANVILSALAEHGQGTRRPLHRVSLHPSYAEDRGACLFLRYVRGYIRGQAAAIFVVRVPRLPAGSPT